MKIIMTTIAMIIMNKFLFATESQFKHDNLVFQSYP